ncbi:MAG: TRAFAC clade GTPase domain-containing protein, partial [Candidatus Rokuibacteriota bacterium]
MSEVAGETLRLARDSTDECRRLTVSRRADHFVILVDGARLVHRQQRFAATHDPGMILRSFVDAEMLGRSAFVDVVFTKWDVVLTSPAAAEVEEFVAAFAEKTRLHCEARVGRLRFFRVAVRPARGAPVAYGHGLDELFVSWVEASAAFVRAPVDPIPMPEGASEFDRYLWRRLPALRPREPAGARR